MSQIHVEPLRGIAAADARAVTWARENGSARHPARHAQFADRVALHALSRKKHMRSCTQGAFRRRASEPFRKICSLASGHAVARDGRFLDVAFFLPPRTER
jgi:hypothetical protein